MKRSGGTLRIGGQPFAVGPLRTPDPGGRTASISYTLNRPDHDRPATCSAIDIQPAIELAA